MKITITRYNRSIIGLMEICNTGNWCEFSEVEDDIDKIDKKFNTLLLDGQFREQTLNAKNQEQTNRIGALEYFQQNLIILVGSSILINLIFIVKICLN